MSQHLGTKIASARAAVPRPPSAAVAASAAGPGSSAAGPGRRRSTRSGRCAPPSRPARGSVAISTRNAASTTAANAPAIQLPGSGRSGSAAGNVGRPVGQRPAPPRASSTARRGGRAARAEQARAARRRPPGARTSEQDRAGRDTTGRSRWSTTSSADRQGDQDGPHPQPGPQHAESRPGVAVPPSRSARRSAARGRRSRAAPGAAWPRSKSGQHFSVTHSSA